MNWSGRTAKQREMIWSGMTAKQREIYFEGDVKFRNIDGLCKQEREFRTKRQRVVFENMKTKFNPKNLLQVDATPNIAIIGSGGGMRAVVGMCGAMTALEFVGILDSAMYTAGVSGSAWYLTTLYALDKQLNPKAVNDTIRRKLQLFRIQFYRRYYLKYLTKAKAFLPGKYFTFTDSFGEMIGDMLLGEKCKQKWSDQRTKLQDGLVPLPLLTALHVTVREYNEWIELSPYEVFIPRYGLAIDMKHFGNKFYGGFITKEYGEKPIHFLQGMCGSGYTIVRDFKPTGNVINFWCRWNKVVDHLFFIFDRTFVGNVPSWLFGIKDLRPLVKDLADDDMDRLIEHEHKMMLVDAGISFNSPYPVILHPDRKVDVIISFDFSDRGEDKNCPFEELSKAKAWADKRNVRFPELPLDEIKKEYAKEGHYKDVYVFDGDRTTPTIVHFLMNNQSVFKLCQEGKSDKTQTVKDRCTIDSKKKNNYKRCTKHTDFDLLRTYPTLKFGYTNEEFDQLKLVVESNVYRNKEKLVKCIEGVISRKESNI